MKISLCLTVFNEENSVSQLLTSLINQTYKVNEIVIVDGGSTDNTVKLIKSFQKKHKFIKVFQKQGNIAVGRNEAVKQATGDVIIMTDAGCVARTDWIAKLVQPFKKRNVQIVAGFYDMPANNSLVQAMSVYHGIHPLRFDNKTFMPSTRSVAFRKFVWKRLGGFNEKLDKTGEDTIFFYSAVKSGMKITRVQEARVEWKEISNYNLLTFVNKTYKYAIGDAQTAIWWDYAKGIKSHNIKILFVFIRYIAAFILMIFSVQFFSYLSLLIFVALYIYLTIYKWRDLKLPIKTLFWVPIVQVLSDFAVMAGFIVGLVLK